MNYIYRNSDIVVSSAYKVIGICSIYFAFEGHIHSWHIYSYGRVNKGAVCCLLPVCAVMYGLYVDYIISAVGHTCVM